jgi:hypothetical protein
VPGAVAVREAGLERLGVQPADLVRDDQAATAARSRWPSGEALARPAWRSWTAPPSARLPLGIPVRIPRPAAA